MFIDDIIDQHVSIVHSSSTISVTTITLLLV